jgi:ubiquinone/menaquinone biosynthesis C-methylase UbiE
MTERKHLGERTDVAAVAALTSVAGLIVVDVGCGAGRTSRELAAIGARVIGVEPDPIQSAKNRQGEPAPGIAFVEARAESLPVDSGSADGVFFFRSLHHVPVETMEAALAEAARALKPETGFLCVVEPGMSGTHFPVIPYLNSKRSLPPITY